MSITRAEQILEAAVSRDGQAVDPATIAVLLGIVTQFVTSCFSRSAKQAAIVAEIRNPRRYTRQKLRDALREQLGEEEYELRGGHKYAANVLNAGQSAKVTEVRSFVAELAQSCGS